MCSFSRKEHCTEKRCRAESRSGRQAGYLHSVEMVTLPLTLLGGTPGLNMSDLAAQPIENWRRGWGLNPRSRCQDSSFRDRSQPKSDGNQTSGKSDESLDGSEE